MFLGGQSYSIADIATFPWASEVGTFLGKNAEADYPRLMAWVATINNRPKVTCALAAVDDVRAKTTAFDKAEGAKDYLFGAAASLLSEERPRGPAGVRQLVKPARVPISAVVGFFMVRPAFLSAIMRRTAIRSMLWCDRTVRS